MKKLLLALATTNCFAGDVLENERRIFSTAHSCLTSINEAVSVPPVDNKNSIFITPSTPHNPYLVVDDSERVYIFESLGNYRSFTKESDPSKMLKTLEWFSKSENFNTKIESAYIRPQRNPSGGVSLSNALYPLVNNSLLKELAKTLTKSSAEYIAKLRNQCGPYLRAIQLSGKNFDEKEKELSAFYSGLREDADREKFLSLVSAGQTPSQALSELQRETNSKAGHND